MSFVGRKEPEVNWAQLEPPKPKLFKSVCSGVPYHIINASPIKGRENEFENYVSSEAKQPKIDNSTLSHINISNNNLIKEDNN